MLLTRQKNELAPPQLNMASMVDVVFLLLIFFMCTSSISQLENSLPSQVSQLGPGAGAESADFPPQIVRVQRVPEGVLVMLGETPCATFERLIEELRRLQSGADAPVLIKGQGDVPFRYMVAALDACHRAGCRRVAFSARGDGS